MTEMIRDGDSLTIALVVKIKLAVRSMLIRKGIRKDSKYKEAKFNKYFEDADYFETIEPNRSVDLSVLFEKDPKLSSRI